MWQLAKTFRFEASHQLHGHDGKCARLHGHSWGGVVYVQGDTLTPSGAKAGMVVDYADIKAALKPLLENYLDHWHLNDSLGIANPTSEEVSRWIFNKLKESGLNVSAVRIDETCTSQCLYTELSEFSNAIAMG